MKNARTKYKRSIVAPCTVPRPNQSGKSASRLEMSALLGVQRIKRGKEMQRNCQFTIEGKIKGKGRPRFSNYGGFVKTYTPIATASYENLIKLQFRLSCGEWYSEMPLKMKITAIHGIVKSASKKDKEKMLKGELKPTKKPDADNIVKIICDALNGIAYKDDTQVVDLEMKKIYGEMEKVIVEIEEI